MSPRAARDRSRVRNRVRLAEETELSRDATRGRVPVDERVQPRATASGSGVIGLQRHLGNRAVTALLRRPETRVRLDAGLDPWTAAGGRTEPIRIQRYGNGGYGRGPIQDLMGSGSGPAPNAQAPATAVTEASSPLPSNVAVTGAPGAEARPVRRADRDRAALGRQWAADVRNEPPDDFGACWLRLKAADHLDAGDAEDRRLAASLRLDVAQNSPDLDQQLTARRGLRGAEGAIDQSAPAVPLVDTDSLDEEQRALRALAKHLAGVDDPGRRAVPDRDFGWARLGMGSHGTHVDKGPGANVTYLRGNDRRERVARLVGGRLVGADRQPVNKAPVTAEKVQAERTMLFTERLVAQLAQRLRSKGLMAEAKELEATDSRTLAASPRWQPLRDAAESDPAARREIASQVGANIAEQEQEWGGGRLIFVMTGSGDFLIGESINAVFHHSSFLAGGAVAAAGDVVVVQGQVKRISNNSGHYKPGAAFLWQAVRQLEIGGADLNQITVEVLGAGEIGAADFLEHFSPLASRQSPRHLSFDPALAAGQVRRFITGRRKARK